jgi:hypothetical protein
MSCFFPLADDRAASRMTRIFSRVNASFLGRMLMNVTVLLRVKPSSDANFATEHRFCKKRRFHSRTNLAHRIFSSNTFRESVVPTISRCFSLKKSRKKSA